MQTHVTTNQIYLTACKYPEISHIPRRNFETAETVLRTVEYGI
jgi:hypothetical protein